VSHLREVYQSGSADYAPCTVNDCLISKSFSNENRADKKVV